MISFVLSGTAFSCRILFFFFNDTATTEIYTLFLHDALPIAHQLGRLLRVHARRGLVEQEQARLRGERAADLDAPAVDLGQLPHRREASRGELAIEQGQEMGGALERAANLD